MAKQQRHKQSQQTNIAQAGQNFFRGGTEIPVTDPLLKWGTLIGLIILPMLMFIIFLGVDSGPHPSPITIIGNKYWITILIAFGWLILSQGIITLLVNKKEKFKIDMFIPGFGLMGLMIGWYWIPQLGWSRAFVMPLTFMAGQLIGRMAFGVRLISKTIKQAKAAQKQMMDMQMSTQNNTKPGERPQTKKEWRAQQMKRQEQQMRAETEMIDQMLREQGIDIDALDKEFGTSIDTGKINSFDAQEVTEFKMDEDIEIVDIVDRKQSNHH